VPFIINSLIFIIGLTGFVSFIYGLWRLEPISAFVLGGAIAMWYSWYVSIGAYLHTKPSTKEGDN